MNKDFTEELQCLAEIEELVENSNLLQDKLIRKRFDLLMELRDELAQQADDEVITESILEDISQITRDITGILEDRLFAKMPAKTYAQKGSKSIN